MDINKNKKMGSCVTKQIHIATISRNCNAKQSLITFRITNQNSVYLRPEIREEIFRAKDSKAPILHLEANKVYLKRKIQVQSLAVFSNKVL